MKATLRRLLSVALLSALSLCPARAQRWQIQAGANLAACVVGSQSFLAAGTYGRILRSDDGGITWRFQESGTRRSINALSFSDPMHGLAVCDGGIALRTDDGGDSWSAVQSPVTGALLDVRMISRDVALACGEEATILKTEDGGRSWRRLTQFPDAGAYYSLCWLGNGVALAVGDSGRIFRTADGGSVWTRISSGVDARLHKIRFSDPMHGVIVGNEGITLVSSDGGKSWGMVMQDPTAFFIRSVAFADPRRVVAVGYSVAGTGILESTNGGGNWSNQGQFGLGPDVAVYDVAFGDDGAGIAVGAESSILRTTDYGQSWQIASYVSISEDGDSRYFYDVKFIDRRNGLVADNKGRIYRTTDGGASWRFTELSTFGGALLSYGGRDTVLAAFGSSRLMRSTDGGSTFSQVQFTATPQRRSFVFSGFQLVDSRVGYMTNALPVFNAPDTLVWRTTDGGESWRGMPVDTGVYSTGAFIFSGPNVGYMQAIGTTAKGAPFQTRVYRTVDGGTSWSRIPFPVDTGLAVLALREGSLGFAAGAGYIYRTEDEGKSWTKVWGESGKSVWNILMVNDSFGVAYGAGSLLLMTTDGGRSWRQADFWAAADYPSQGWFFGMAAPDRTSVVGVGGAVMVLDGASGAGTASVEGPRRCGNDSAGHPDHRLHAYPNPWRDGPLTIDLPDVAGTEPPTVRVVLHDLLGREIADLDADVARREDGTVSVSIPRERIPGEGIFLLRVVAGNRSGAERVIVIR